jgi:transcription initiation factor TFIID subunit 12
MLGSLGSNSQMRPGGMPSHQQRPVQSSLRPPPSAQNNQPAGSQVSILSLLFSVLK